MSARCGIFKIGLLLPQSSMSRTLKTGPHLSSNRHYHFDAVTYPSMLDCAARIREHNGQSTSTLLCSCSGVPSMSDYHPIPPTGGSTKSAPFEHVIGAVRRPMFTRTEVPRNFQSRRTLEGLPFLGWIQASQIFLQRTPVWTGGHDWCDDGSSAFGATVRALLCAQAMCSEIGVTTAISHPQGSNIQGMVVAYVDECLASIRNTTQIGNFGRRYCNHQTNS